MLSSKTVRLVSSGVGVTAQTIDLSSVIQDVYQGARYYVLTVKTSVLNGAPTNVTYVAEEVLSGSDVYDQAALTVTGVGTNSTGVMNAIGKSLKLKIAFTGGTAPSVDYTAYLTLWEN